MPNCGPSASAIGMSHRSTTRSCEARIGESAGNGGRGSSDQAPERSAAKLGARQLHASREADEIRAAHVAKHGMNILQPPSHGVFCGDPGEAVIDASTMGQKGGIEPVTLGGVDMHLIPRPNLGYAGGSVVREKPFTTSRLLRNQEPARLVQDSRGTDYQSRRGHEKLCHDRSLPRL